MRILGIDPGTSVVGYGIVDRKDGQLTYVECGIIKATHKDYSERIFQIGEQIAEVIRQFNPLEGAIEEAFIGPNPKSGMKVAESRGAYKHVMRIAGIKHIMDIQPTIVKKALTAEGGASKEEVSESVMRILGLKTIPVLDATDALAIAITRGYDESVPSPPKTRRKAKR